MAIRFGPAGNSESFYAEGHKSTLEMPKWVAALGLSAFEYSCGRGVQLRQDTATAIGRQAQEYDIAMSVHAPYFINLAAEDEERRGKTINYIMQSLQAARWMGASRVVMHPGSCAKRDRGEAMAMACVLLKRVLHEYREQGYEQAGIRLCVEAMGKQNQLGRLDEIITLCQLDESLLPAIDFGHINALTNGGLATREDFAQVLDALEVLGERGRGFHIHFSHIEYTKAGEKKHLTFADTQFGPDFALLAPLLAERKLQPVVICESDGTMAEDAVAMREMYLAAVG